VFEEIAPSILPLSTDVFGNYVVQKAFEYGNASQVLVRILSMNEPLLMCPLQSLSSSLKDHILQLSLQMYGCRVVQKAIEALPADFRV
jgi:hypothetical protein